MKGYKHIYGPVSSWRLGSSLGIDPIYAGRGKVCSFDCIYCQAGRTRKLTAKRKVFVPTEKIAEELNSLPPLKIDYITLSGAGEPTLAKNLGEIIKEARSLRKRIAVLTNSSIIDRKSVQDDLALADFVIAKLDAHTEELFTKINKPPKTIKLAKIIKGLKEFKSRYKGRFALQIMFVKENKKYASEIAALAREIDPDEIQINTPLRPCHAKPLSEKEIDALKIFFKGTKYISVYDGKRKKVLPIDREGTLKRGRKINV